MTKPIAQFPRHGSKRKPRKTIVPTEYPPGYFLALVVKHNWPPRFEPQYQSDRGGWSDARTLIERRERQALGGVGWGGGTVVLPGTPGLLRPKMTKGRG